ncbi:MAG: IS1182 family transposase, partial [Shimia sp.]|nr:IS1182 family transposase [Shimia sp.]
SLARFVVEVVEQLDTSALENAYRGGGSAPYPPKMMLALLFYCYAQGIFSSRKIERATYEWIPVIYLAGGWHPDHDSINRFRKRFLSELGLIFVMILQIAHGLGVFKLGEISLDGTKIKANASKHKAMSWAYACRLEEQLRTEVEDLLKRAETENAKAGKEFDLPAEMARREQRLEKIAEIKAELETRAQARYEQEQADYDAKLVERAAKEAERGRKLGGRVPKAPEPGPRPQDQVNFTDPDARILPTSGGGFIQGYNAQASVEIETLLIVGQHMSQKSNDKQEVEPALAELNTLPEAFGKVERAALDNGYFSAANVEKIVAQEIEPYIASARQNHNPTLEERQDVPGQGAANPTPVEAVPPSPSVLSSEVDRPANPTPVEAMQQRMKTAQGKTFYAKRKSTVEPVFGIIKEVMGFRHFLLRGFEAVKGEWTLVCIAYNLKRLCALNT